MSVEKARSDGKRKRASAPSQQSGNISAPQQAPEAAKNKQEPAGELKVSRVLKVGKPLMKGKDVKALQSALVSAGFNCGPEGANGVFGKDTAHAVRMYQAMNRLIVDGKAGRYTVASLGGVWES